MFQPREALADESISGLFRRLIADGRELAGAEIRLRKTMVAARLGELKVAIALGFVAVLLVTSSLVGLIVGCVIGLAPWLGPVGAGAVVTLGTLVLAGVCGWLAAKQFSRPSPTGKDRK